MLKKPKPNIRFLFRTVPINRQYEGESIKIYFEKAFFFSGCKRDINIYL